MPTLNLKQEMNISAAADGTKFDLEKVRAQAAGSEFFHGATSGSLLTFTNPNPDLRGQLMSMRQMLSNGVATFTGEQGNSLHPRAPDAVSTVDLRNFGQAYNYADSKSGFSRPAWSADDTKKALGDARAQSSPESGLAPEAGAKANLHKAQLERYESMSPGDKALVQDNFPVLYGVSGKVPQSRLMSGNSSIPGEVLIKGGVKPSEIATLFVPEAQVGRVQQLVGNGGAPHIKVASLESVAAQDNAAPGSSRQDLGRPG